MKLVEENEIILYRKRKKKKKPSLNRFGSETENKCCFCFTGKTIAAIARRNLFNPVHSHFKEVEVPLADYSSIRQYYRDCQILKRNVVLRHKRNAKILPKVRAQNVPDYVPDSKFYKVEAIVRSWRVHKVSSALLKMGIRGVTVSDAKGFGAQGGSKERQGGSEFSEDKFVAKVKIEIVMNEEQVEAVVDKIIEESRTGEIGAGKIFLIPVSDIIRVRTGERGEKAARMTGGQADMSSAA